MVYLAVLLIAAANCFVVYFLSILAVGGDGSSDGIIMVRIFGFAWIAVLSIVSLVLCARERGASAIWTSVMALPTAYLAGLALILVGAGFSWLKPNSSEFEAACKDAGATFIASPATPVHSIAYDWEDKYPPEFNYFTVGLFGNVSNLSGGTGSPYPASIAFTESRCCRYEGRSRVGPYNRMPNDGAYFGVEELTADALVMFHSSPIGAQSTTSNLMQVQIDVTDRRDGRHLASLRYLLDKNKRRGCGTTSKGVMDERAFVLQAVGVR